jgi:hypothetical protein
MTRKLRLAAPLTAAAAAAALVPLAASADRGPQSHDDRHVAIGVRLDFSSATQAAGTFSACCAINDSGAARAEITSFVPGDDNRARFEAINSFSGTKGTFRIRLRGSTGPLGSPNHVAHARWRVLDGTGAYAGLEGGGRLTAVTDQNSGALTALDVGEVRP